MGLNVNAVRKWLGTGLVLSLLTPASAALASDSKVQKATDDKSDITLYGDAYSTWQLTSVGNVVVDGRSALAYDRLYLREGRPPVVGSPASGVDEPRPGDAAVS